MAGLCDEKVVIVTGGGRGIGRAHSLEFARQGAAVVVNDVGSALDGAGVESSPAQSVVGEIVSAGGAAVANSADVANWSAGEELVEVAYERFGRLDAVVNNAGILKDRMLFNMSERDWDDVIRTHLKGTACVTRHAASRWRAMSKDGHPVDGRIINTTSGSGLFGNLGQANYSAAKAGIAGFTLTASLELARYGVAVNAVCPAARTRMTDDVGLPLGDAPNDGTWDEFDPRNISPLVVWCASRDAKGVTGRVFEVVGGRICVLDGWRRGPTVERAERWAPSAVGSAVRDLLSRMPAPETLAP